jgi:hypothetical protein
VPFAYCTKAQDESTTAFRRASLVGVPDDARIEQGRCLERVLMKKICPYQAALRSIQFGMRLQRLFHIRSARLEDVQQIPVTAFEIIEHVRQLSRGSFGIEPKNPVDDMIGPGLIGRVEVSGFSLEGPDHDPGWIRAQI